MPATAADVPPELFATILEHLADDPSTNQRWTTNNYKHDLSVIALTCRYWAGYCRPPLFRSLRLQSREDVYELEQLLTQSNVTLGKVAPISRHILSIMVAPLQETQPWIHLVSSLLLPKLSHDTQLFLGLEGTRFVSEAKHPIHSIHHNLPKTLPAVYSLFHSLHISDIHFRCVTDLTRLLNELTHLRRLHCMRLTWSDPSPPTLETWVHMRYPRTLERVDAEDCTDNWLLFGLFARRVFPTDQCTQLQQHILPPHEIQHATELIQLCQRVSGHPSGTHSNMVAVQGQMWMSGNGYDILNTATGLDIKNSSDYHPPDVMFGVQFTQTLNYFVQRTSLRQEPRESHITSIVIDCVGSTRWCWHTWDCEWESFVELATQFHHLERIVFGFISQSNLERFVKKAGDSTGLFLNTGRLWYAIALGRNRVAWAAVDAVTLKQSDPPALYDRLQDVGTEKRSKIRRGSAASTNLTEAPN